MTDSERIRLRSGASELGIALTELQLDQFAAYGRLLQDWNRRLNLTRVRSEDYVILHYLDSLASATAVNLVEVGSMIDIGTGAGLPGVPLKIAFPRLNVTLLDSTRKRLTFVDTVIESLRLDNTETIHARAEDLASNRAHRGRYDLAVARAVARMDVLAGWLLPFVRTGGSALALKSAGAEQEIAEALPKIHRLGGATPRIDRITLPNTDIPRLLITIRKQGTSRKPQ